MYLTHYTEDGTIIGFYLPGLHVNIPSPTIEVTKEQHAEYFTKGQSFKVINGEFTYISPPGMTPADQQATMQKQLTDAVQAHMDSIAKVNGYDNILSAVTYAEESAVPKFQTEGIAYRAWRSAVWEYCYAQLAAVLKGEREAPTAEELIEELPELVLPE